VLCDVSLVSGFWKLRLAILATVGLNVSYGGKDGKGVRKRVG
jgi:hypothetical protein